MNFSVNNVNFQGKNEVIYGIKKAAQEAKNLKIAAAYSYGPRPMNKMDAVYQAKGALDAYSDMLVHDETFVETINEISKDKNILDQLNNILTPVKTICGYLYPHQSFVESINKAAQNAGINAKSGLNNFFNNFKM